MLAPKRIFISPDCCQCRLIFKRLVKLLRFDSRNGREPFSQVLLHSFPQIFIIFLPLSPEGIKLFQDLIDSFFEIWTPLVDTLLIVLKNLLDRFIHRFFLIRLILLDILVMDVLPYIAISFE